MRSLPEGPTDRHLLLHRDHSRRFEQNLYVYAVLSRRSQGISIGINLNPDKVCNFDCVYCQVDRRTPSQVVDVDEGRLLRELEETLELVLWAGSPGSAVRDRTRLSAAVERYRLLGGWRANDLSRLASIVQNVAAIKTSRNLEPLKLVLITNATMLHRTEVKERSVVARCQQR